MKSSKLAAVPPAKTKIAGPSGWKPTPSWKRPSAMGERKWRSQPSGSPSRERVELVPEDEREVAAQRHVADLVERGVLRFDRAHLREVVLEPRDAPGQEHGRQLAHGERLARPGRSEDRDGQRHAAAAAAQLLLHVLVEDVAHAAQALDLRAVHRRPGAHRLDRDAEGQRRGPAAPRRSRRRAPWRCPRTSGRGSRRPRSGR